jgi:hypothetical protein
LTQGEPIITTWRRKFHISRTTVMNTQARERGRVLGDTVVWSPLAQVQKVQAYRTIKQCALFLIDR